jgi:capsular polysaccharide biosynthesis protein/Mrp family chromosome partitioning ATPase
MSIQNTLRHYSHVLHRHFLLILSGVLIGSGITLAVSMRLPPTYQAHALIRVNNAATASNSTGNNDVFSTQALAVSYALLVTGPDVLQNTARQFPGTNAEQLKPFVSASPLDNTQIIEVRAQAPSALQAARIANALAATFIKLQVEKESTRLQQATDQLMQTLAQTKLQIANEQQQLTTLQGNNAGTEEITRQQSLLDGDQANYNALLTHYNLLQTQKMQARTILSVEENATPPNGPAGSPLWLNVGLAGLLSFLLLALLVLLLDWLDATIATEQDVERLAGLTPLGCIPHSKRANRLLNLGQEENDPAWDAYALLGTSLQALPQARDVQMVLLTALRGGAGTSTGALYLAVTLAQAGQRVLLVEANSRRPVLHTVFQRSNATGLTTALQDIQACQRCPDALSQLWLNQWKTHLPDLWFLPAGPERAGSVSVLQTVRALGELLTTNIAVPTGEHAPGLVDWVIFDALSLAEGTGAQALAALVDATILVVEAGKERGDGLQRAQGQLQRRGAPVLGVIINRQRKWHRDYLYSAAPQPLSGVERAVDLPRRSQSQVERKLPQALPVLPSTPPMTAQSFPGSDLHTQRIPTVSLDDLAVDTPLPLLITRAEPVVSARSDNQISFEALADASTANENSLRPQFAPRLRLNSLSGGMKLLGGDTSTEEQ